MYPTANLQNSFTYPFYPSPNFVIDQAMLSRVAALFSATPADVSDHAFNSSSSSSNTIIASDQSESTVPCSPSSAPGLIRNKGRRLEFCKVCQRSITEEGKRSQGPRRHILMNHMCRPLFFCPYPNCKATSNYDKAHITNHIKRMHNNIGEVIVLEKHWYAEEEDRWFKLCFGTGSEKPSNENSDDDNDEKIDVKGPFTPTKAVEVEIEDDVNENIMEAPSKPLPPIPFTIDWILSK